jgi:hypothetical protein
MDIYKNNNSIYLYTKEKAIFVCEKPSFGVIDLM